MRVGWNVSLLPDVPSRGGGCGKTVAPPVAVIDESRKTHRSL